MTSPTDRGAHFVGYLAALASAAMVGIFTVLNKWLLVASVPTLTAGAWTYLAAGLALSPAALRRGGLKLDRGRVLAMWLAAGSVLGPSLYFVGLSYTSGVQGVLLVNMEAVFTSLIAFALFRERLTLVTCIAGALILAGGVVVSWPEEGATLAESATIGNLLISLGYLGWATENNLGRLLGEDMPAITLACVKALVAAVAMAVLASAFRQPLAVPLRVVPWIVASGGIALGSSLALFYFAMTRIGAGRAGLISSTSTLWGVAAAVGVLEEQLSPVVIGGGLIMLIGLAFFAWEAARTEALKEGA